MRVLCVVDNISNINSKIQMLKNRFGDNILFVVKKKFANFFKTFSYQTDAIYTVNLAKVVHTLLSRVNIDDLVIYYTSLKITDDLLNKFNTRIFNTKMMKIVNVVPSYNIFERFSNAIYNLYVRSIFKLNDNLASAKLQFLQKKVVGQLLDSHIANRLFEVDEEYVSNIYVGNREINKSLKTELKFNKNYLIPIIVALCITLALIVGIVFVHSAFILVLVFTVLYVLDIILTVIYHCKSKFDARFLK